MVLSRKFVVLYPLPETQGRLRFRAQKPVNIWGFVSCWCSYLTCISTVIHPANYAHNGGCNASKAKPISPDGSTINLPLP